MLQRNAIDHINVAAREAYTAYVRTRRDHGGTSYGTDADHFMTDYLQGWTVQFGVRDVGGYEPAVTIKRVTNAGFAGFQILGQRSDGTYATTHVSP